MIPEDANRGLKFDAAVPISSTIASSEDVANRARRHTARRLLPFLFVLYVVAFLDRMNVSAAALQMPGDLGFSDRAVGLVAGGGAPFSAARACTAVLLGLVALFSLTAWPRQAHWLPSDEREWIIAQLEKEKKAKQAVRSYSIWQALRHRDVILLTASYFFGLTGNYGIAFWLPTMLKRLSGQSDLKVTLLASLPYLAGFLTQQWNGWHSDRTRERRWHAAIPVLLSGVALF